MKINGCLLPSQKNFSSTYLFLLCFWTFSFGYFLSTLKKPQRGPSRASILTKQNSKDQLWLSLCSILSSVLHHSESLHQTQSSNHDNRWTSICILTSSPAHPPGVAGPLGQLPNTHPPICASQTSQHFQHWAISFSKLTLPVCPLYVLFLSTQLAQARNSSSLIPPPCSSPPITHFHKVLSIDFVNHSKIQLLFRGLVQNLTTFFLYYYLTPQWSFLLLVFFLLS